MQRKPLEILKMRFEFDSGLLSGKRLSSVACTAQAKSDKNKNILSFMSENFKHSFLIPVPPDTRNTHSFPFYTRMVHALGSVHFSTGLDVCPIRMLPSISVFHPSCWESKWHKTLRSEFAQAEDLSKSARLNAV